ncbi:methylmalonyl-CoA mutase, N-terminal domain/subunit [Dethiobacter alkaliphilus AHT 1]|uniref:Methylmalonyl-CoA mutase, N-terminal domain/subunit n=1 Tax=Dethiobacter alkaliphilus AHT 1 TaxID=555088 RepID=C0GH71_DETAL|nr:methylmalonyl-CoA mutase, N-terminal domain/subunit [Dethiobacter alkaliphilus AHT 1]
MGGSYYIEALTDQIEQDAAAYIEKIDGMGGAVDAIEKGFMQKEIQQSAYTYQRQIETGERVVIGVNKFITEAEAPKDLLKVNPAVADSQVDKLKKLQENRDQRQVAEALRNLRSVAQSSDNIMPAIIEAVKVYATLGEICGILREVFGEYQQQVML